VKTLDHSQSPIRRHLVVSRFSLYRLLVVASVAIFAVVVGKAWTPPVHATGEPTIASVSVGENSACALLADTTVRCWGSNYDGELGDGTFIDKASPQVVPGLTGVTSLAMGSRHVCAAITGGTVKCWGWNIDGQLGNSIDTDADTWPDNSSSPIAVAGLTGVTSLISGARHLCAIITGGTVKCWGMNYFGQLGNSINANGDTDLDSSATPIAVSGLTGVVSLSLGDYHSCAVITGGTVKCWGYNSNGQLGNSIDANADTYLDDSSTPIAVAGLTGVVSLSLGHLHSCALLTDSTVKCWGYNYYGQLGDGTTTNSSVPVAVPALTGVATLTVGGNSSCAVLPGGAAKCWGGNKKGLFGNGTTTDSSSPVSLTGFGNVVVLSVGPDFSCALLVSGSVQCVGDRWGGKLGDGSFAYRPTPAVVPNISATQAVSGNSHMCVLVSGGTVKCWGYNVYGQLGDGSQSDRQLPVVVAGLTNVAAVSNGEHFSCAVITGGTVKCWGYNVYGQLGDGTDVNSTAPVSVANLTNVVSISLGYTHACAIITGGTVKCWGFNGNGQLGDGTTIGEGPTGNNNKTPTEVTGLTGAQSLSLGTLHSCAVITGGAVKCWGDNTLGELGNTTNISSSTPVAVSGLSGVLSISASRPYGGSHTCAVITGGTLKCWGVNAERQLGDGSLINRNTPVLVPGLTGVSTVSSGYRHTCVVLTDGTARCWGSNTYGQLGDGTIINRAAPVAVSSLIGVASISSGNMHTCALLADATAKCWGGSSYGQLGDDMGWATSPVNVPFNSSPPVTTVPVTTVSATTVPATTTTTATTATTVPTSNVIGIPVLIRKMPTSAVAQRAEVGVNKTKVMVLLVTPKATKPINQVTKYIVQLKPKSGRTITKTINVRSGATVKPTLTGKKKVTYALTVTAVTKGGKMTSWKGPSVKTS